VHGLDDLVRIDALQVNRGHAEVAVTELALNDIERHALASELDRVRVTQLVRSEATPHAGPGGAPAQRGAGSRGIPRAPAGAPIDDAEQRTDRHPLAHNEPRLELLKAPVIHTDLTATTTLATPDQHRAATTIEIELAVVERLLDPQPGRKSTAIKPRARAPWTSSPQQRMTAMISSVRGGSGG
jgi:hypothetical protein